VLYEPVQFVWMGMQIFGIFNLFGIFVILPRKTEVVLQIVIWFAGLVLFFPQCMIGNYKQG
jgi:hypothetical protein